MAETLLACRAKSMGVMLVQENVPMAASSKQQQLQQAAGSPE